MERIFKRDCHINKHKESIDIFFLSFFLNGSFGIGFWSWCLSNCVNCGRCHFSCHVIRNSFNNMVRYCIRGSSHSFESCSLSPCIYAFLSVHFLRMTLTLVTSVRSRHVLSQSLLFMLALQSNDLYMKWSGRINGPFIEICLYLIIGINYCYSCNDI